MAVQALRRKGWGRAVAELAPLPDTRLHGTAASIEVRSAADGGPDAEATAELLLSRCQDDLRTICDIFEVAGPAEVPIRVVLMPRPIAVPAVHDGSLVQCDIAAGAAARQRQAVYTCYLLATQLVEIVAATHDRGWDGSSAHGEALARTLAAALYPRMHLDFTTGAAWLLGARGDAVNRRVPSDSDEEAIGCAALFLNYLHHELDIDWRTIVRAGAPTLAVTYRRVTGAFDDPFPAFRDALVGVEDLPNDNPFPRTTIVATDLVPARGRQAAHTRSRPEAAAAAVAEPRTDDVPELSDVLAHRRWWTVDAPFRHLRAEEVFVPEVYDDIVATFRERKAKGDLTRSLPGYDASAAAVTAGNAGGFAVFLTREWHDMVAGLLGIDATGDVIATLHHHAPGSASGSLHNDLNPGWFPQRESAAHAGPIAVHDPAISNYRTGGSAPGVATVEHIRAISLLYYLDTPADVQGGGTGLYRSAHQSVTEPEVVVAPKNNSLIAFECTPFSFHTFISNIGRERNCLTMWLHRERSDAVALWGAGSIVRW